MDLLVQENDFVMHGQEVHACSFALENTSQGQDNVDACLDTFGLCARLTYHHKVACQRVIGLHGAHTVHQHSLKVTRLLDEWKLATQKHKDGPSREKRKEKEKEIGRFQQNEHRKRAMALCGNGMTTAQKQQRLRSPRTVKGTCFDCLCQQ